MTLVKYTNKKTGTVTLYESTSHYDPETKQSRPIRKYLGRVDPETGKLIPSTKRKKKEPASVAGQSTDDYMIALQEKIRECEQKNQRIKELEAEIARLRSSMSRIATASRSIMEISSKAAEN
ncbi:MAG: hypothetical protein IKR56_08010 [Lachnospiraceae bacterium]|jgi:hypothetical protein|nr:hypothetical protein [Lachnospiraceae bacterium]